MFIQVSCEDPELRKPGTPETVYEAITTLGRIFNVPTVASKLIDDMKNDFELAEKTLANSAGHSLTAVYNPNLTSTLALTLPLTLTLTKPKP